jgi:segregation and condensation protein B
MTSDRTSSLAPCSGLHHEADQPRDEGTAVPPEPNASAAPVSATADVVTDSAGGDTPGDPADTDQAPVHRDPTQAGSADAGLADASRGDAGSRSAGPADASLGDASPGDADPGDADPGDADPDDAGSGDAGQADAGLGDAVSEGTASADPTEAARIADGAAGQADAAPGDADAGSPEPAPPAAEPDEESLRLAEALIFASAGPVSARALSQLLPDTADADAVIAALRARYAGRGVQLVDTAGGVQFRTAPELAPRLRKVIEVPRRLPRVAMETLAIIAYHQPCTRAEIEEIRGTSLSQQTLDALLEANLVAPKGRREVPGRPTLWGTTPQFLLQFGLRDIRDLPQRADLLLEPPRPSGVSDAPPLTSDLSPPQPGPDHPSGENPAAADSADPADGPGDGDSPDPAGSDDPGDSPAPADAAAQGASPGSPGEPNPAPEHNLDRSPLSRG